jgi:hypothetical protein
MNSTVLCIQRGCTRLATWWNVATAWETVLVRGVLDRVESINPLPTIALSYNGNTADFGSANRGSIPWRATCSIGVFLNGCFIIHFMERT